MCSNKRTRSCLLLFLILYFFTTSSAFGQERYSSLIRATIDSAQQLVIEKPKSALQLLAEIEDLPVTKELPQTAIDIYSLKAKGYLVLGKEEEANNYYDNAIALSQKLHTEAETIELLIDFAHASLQFTQKDLAYQLFRKAIKLSKLSNDPVLVAKSRYYLATYYYTIKDFNNTIQECYTAEKLIRDIPKQRDLKIKIYMLIGNINSLTDNKDEALINYQTALNLCQAILDTDSILRLYFNIGNLYTFKEDTAKAQEYYLKYWDLSRDFDSPFHKAFADMTMAELMINNQKQYKKAQKYLKSGIIRFKEINKYSSLNYSYGLLAITQLHLGQKDKALLSLKKMDALFPKFVDNFNKVEILSAVSKTCSEHHLYKEAYKYQIQKEALDKKTFDEESKKELLKVRTEYETKEKEASIALLEKENSTQVLIEALLIILLLVLGIGSYLLWRQKTSLKNKNKALRKAKLEAEKLAQSKSQFLATMSHEIRTPMNGVIGMANILKEENPRPDQLKSLDILQFSANNLINLINDVLDLAKIESGRIELEKNEFDLKNFCDKAFTIFQTAKKKSIVNLKLDLNLDELTHNVIADKMRFNQVLTNLISNAVKFTNEGEVCLKIDLMSQFDRKAVIRFKVSDTGIGISEENQKKIFGKYEQAETNTARIYGGTGLGLNISKEILELFGSELNLNSQIGKGSTFWFDVVLPLGDTISNKAIAHNSSTDAKQLSGMTILLVEDNQVNQIVAKKILARWGVDLKIAQNGQEGVEMAREHDFDLILMDIQMPIMDGFEASEKIRQFAGQKRMTPIYALSASAFSKTEKVRAQILNGYIAKPFHPKELFNVIAQHYTKQSNGNAVFSQTTKLNPKSRLPNY